MKAYWIAKVNVNDEDAYAEYAKRAGPAIEKYKGRFLVRGGEFEILEGKNKYERNVVVEFPSFKIAKEFYYSSEYKLATKMQK